MSDFDPEEQRKRAMFMNHLYEQSGRDDLPIGDPRHKTYTGMWQEFMLRLANDARDAWWTANHG